MIYRMRQYKYCAMCATAFFLKDEDDCPQCGEKLVSTIEQLFNPYFTAIISNNTTHPPTINTLFMVTRLFEKKINILEDALVFFPDNGEDEYGMFSDGDKVHHILSVEQIEQQMYLIELKFQQDIEELEELLKFQTINEEQYHVAVATVGLYVHQQLNILRRQHQHMSHVMLN
jgi:hypothetical protein